MPTSSAPRKIRGSIMMASSDDMPAVRVWNVAKNSERQRARGHEQISAKRASPVSRQVGQKGGLNWLAMD